MSDAVPAIDVRHLTMAYGSFVVMRDLNFRVEPGEIFVIMGGSGCGKSTLLKHMVGLKRPAHGHIRYGRDDLWDADEEGRRQLLHRIGVLYQYGALWSGLTLAENVALPLQEYTDLSSEEIQGMASLKLALSGLRGFDTFYPSEISGGMRKRAALARALALDPQLLFFDEPSSGLDPVSANRLDELIVQLRDSLGTTIVVVSHDLDSIFAIADRAVYLDADERTMTALGNPHDLLHNPPNESVARFLTRGGVQTRR